MPVSNNTLGFNTAERFSLAVILGYLYCNNQMKVHMYNEYMAQVSPQPPEVQNTAFYKDFFLASQFLLQSLEITS